ncbi:hypothetical protein OsJ_23949 [Oryza sativa Japonica Group]|uniref:Uncharacterized protein n=1 Tax=Oryza sativa subsp. japonica TaxID=39947 RepID=A3BIX3_ORYSJ|nr:hypothetical protein OsJ_23949 [Oryza sativa Japonica Group]
MELLEAGAGELEPMRSAPVSSNSISQPPPQVPPHPCAGCFGYKVIHAVYIHRMKVVKVHGSIIVKVKVDGGIIIEVEVDVGVDGGIIVEVDIDGSIILEVEVGVIGGIIVEVEVDNSIILKGEVGVDGGIIIKVDVRAKVGVANVDINIVFDVIC